MKAGPPGLNPWVVPCLMGSVTRANGFTSLCLDRDNSHKALLGLVCRLNDSLKSFRRLVITIGDLVIQVRYAHDALLLRTASSPRDLIPLPLCSFVLEEPPGG